MVDSHTAFIGAIPEYYDQYLGPLIFEEYAVDLAQRLSVPVGGTVLETAAQLSRPKCKALYSRHIAPMWV
ncbi:MAG: hypothetical protein GY796_14790 [Chloroflexi bacterium]|nr:hypothetical protein [Chloroflexota bacterium]